MKNRLIWNFISIILLLSVLILPFVMAETSIDKAKNLFKTFDSLGKRFDPKLGDLYADNAIITAKRIYQNGATRSISLNGQQHKKLLLKIMPIAKQLNDRDDWTNISYQPEGQKVRITATRHSLMRNYTAPHVLLVGPTLSGKWQILEEHAIQKLN